MGGAVLFLFAPITLSADNLPRQTVTKEITLNAPAEMVWDLISDFCSIAEWHPGVAACEGRGGVTPGTTRVLNIGAIGGSEIHEELEHFDFDQMSYTYKITKTDNSVVPVSHYSAALTVLDAGNETTKATWRGTFSRADPNADPSPDLDDESAAAAISDVYESGLEEIERIR